MRPDFSMQKCTRLHSWWAGITNVILGVKIYKFHVFDLTELIQHLDELKLVW